MIKEDLFEKSEQVLQKSAHFANCEVEELAFTSYRIGCPDWSTTCELAASLRSVNGASISVSSMFNTVDVELYLN